MTVVDHPTTSTISAVRPQGRKVVKSDKMTTLGHAAGRRYATIDGLEGEYVVMHRREDLPERDGIWLIEDTYGPDDPAHQLPIGAVYREAIEVPAGTYEAEKAKLEGRQQAAAPHVLSALVHPFFAASPERLRGYTEDGQPRIIAARGRLLGAEAIIAALARKGVVPTLAPGDDAIVLPVRTGDGAAVEACIQAAPLLIPYLATGKPPKCAVSKHAAEAVDLALAYPSPLPWCGSCVPKP